MVADSFTDSGGLFHGSPISRDLPKKRKANWFWKLKQWKIDPRRRQWISQWKRENLGEEENGCRLKSLRDKLSDKKTSSDTFSYFQALRVDHEEGCYDGFTKCHDCDDDDDNETKLDRTSSASSPTSVLKNKDSNSNKSWDDCFCCSKQITDEDEEAFDDAFDNWDGFSDALNSFEAENDESEAPELEKGADPNPKTNQRKNKSNPKNLFHEDKCKQATSPGKAIHDKNKKKKKSEKQECDEENDCPICSEKMDATDLSFSPCPCGFRLCLFCHKQVNENDQRCPSCRKKYVVKTKNNNGEVSFLQRGSGTLRLSPSFRGLDRAKR